MTYRKIIFIAKKVEGYNWNLKGPEEQEISFSMK